MKKIAVFTGAGISAESGIKTFRDGDGLWEEFDIMDVATPEAWSRQPRVVLEFYNARRKQALLAKPNQAHKIIAELQDHFEVQVITQNIDNLHEEAGSKKILHLHGEIMKARSSMDPNLIYDLKGKEIKWGETCEMGSQLRPHVVWFGEEVPAMPMAEKLVMESDLLLVVGTSLNVYPAAGLVYAASGKEIVVVDPGEPLIPQHVNVVWIREKASTGMEKVKSRLLA